MQSETQFSRRHKTPEAHQRAQARKEARIQETAEIAARNREARVERTPAQQLAHLDKILGRDKGAQRERRRLKLQMETKRGS